RRVRGAPGVPSDVAPVRAPDPDLDWRVLLDGRKKEKWGSEAAAPMFSAIGREALRYLNVPPADTVPVPLVRGEMTAAATAIPPVADNAARVMPVGLSVDDAPAVMPRVERRSLRQAMEMLAPLDVELEISGRGLVQPQWPPAGPPLNPGTVCRLTLASPVAGLGVSQ